MPKKCGGTSGQAIGTGLEDNDEIAHVCGWQTDVVTEQIEWGAKATDYRNGLPLKLIHLVADDDGIVAADHLAKIA